MMKKAIALLLALLMLIPSVISCADPDSKDQDDSNAETTTEPVNGETEEIKSALIPADLNYGGETVTIVSRDFNFVVDEILVEEINGMYVNDSVYRRDERVQKQLGITFESIKTGGDNAYAISEMLRTAANTDEAEFDIIANSTYSTIMYAAEGILCDLNDCEYLDLDAVYWSQGFNENASIGESQYLVTGALAVSLLRYMFVSFFNKRVLENAQWENLYDVVDAGKWTLDYQIELSKSVFKDNDGSQSVTENDIIGFGACTTLYVDPYWSACDIRIISRDADNYLVYDLDQERLSDAVDKLIELFHESNAFFHIQANDTDGQEVLGKTFGSGDLATTSMRLCSVETPHFTNMEDEYGVIPMPKLNEEQKNYGTYIHDQVTAFGITSVHKNDDERIQMLGAVLEALAVEGYNLIVPTYYDAALKGRYLKDSESWQMLDMIYNNVKIDTGVLYTRSLDEVHQQPRSMVRHASNTVASTYGTLKYSLTKRIIPKLNEAYMELED